MEKYLDLVSKYGLQGEEALKFAAERLDKDNEREERRLERDKRLERERENREKEREHELEIERIRLQATRENMHSSDIANRRTENRPKIPPFEDGKDDMGSYLSRFERLAEANQWAREEWATSLSALLTGHALDTYSRLSKEDAENYDCLRAALLNRYGLTGEGYRKKLREAKPDFNETPGQFIHRLNAYVTRWVDMTGTERSYEGLCDLLVQEQFMECCPRQLQVYLKEKGTTELGELAAYAETFTDAHECSFYSLCKGSAEKSQSVRRGVPPPRRSSPHGSATALRASARNAASLPLLRLSTSGRRMPKSQELDIDRTEKPLAARWSLLLVFGRRTPGR